MNNVGIYTIYNTVTHKFYIGSSINLKQRLLQHYNALINNRHHSKYLQRSWNKYGPNTFLFRILRNCTLDQCIPLEQYFINAVNPEYNSCKIAGSCRGIKRSEKTKRKFSIAKMGQVVSEETREKIRKGNSKPIIQMDLDFNIINEYDSVLIASKCFGVTRAAIIACAQGKNKTSAGYVWKYKNNNICQNIM